MVYLTYHDADIDEEAVTFYDDGRWLNDKCIDLYLEYLEHTIVPQERFKADIFFLRASMTFFLSNIDKSNISIYSPPELKSASIIFLVVNNNSDVSRAGGGTHWSLLVYVRELKLFFQYDSYKSMNELKAKYVAETIFGLDKVDIIETNAPQQMNDHECGVFVLSFAESIFKKNKHQFDTQNDKKK
ncbi:hypothetical protein Glove_25g7 [Diversispora epigaea]|uniref:Ubiquitin-like protease family profile domain-containing protein n=1 Tax=Diversispora epigaea TaxID=1348612 RepID=A0A397JQE5_9GLOM|nr:hypothetical protein Glove_25g7 [Diversispora epigaea]